MTLQVQTGRWHQKTVPSAAVKYWQARRWPTPATTTKNIQKGHNRCVTTQIVYVQIQRFRFSSTNAKRRTLYQKTTVNVCPCSPRETTKGGTSSVSVNRTRNRTWTLRQFTGFTPKTQQIKGAWRNRSPAAIRRSWWTAMVGGDNSRNF